MGKTALLVHFNELHDYEKPVDEAGNVSPFVPAAGMAMPTSVEGILGRAREFSPTQVLAGVEAVPDSTRLLRDVTIEAVVKLAGDGTYSIAARGDGSGDPSERVLWELLVDVAGADATVRMAWQDAADVAAGLAGVTFQPPAGWLFLAAARRWTSTTDVVVDYYCNGEHLGRETSAVGDLAGGIGGTVFVGPMPAGGTLDELRVSNVARSAEELRAAYRRLFVFPSYGYELLRALQPPGEAWSRNPASKIQRFFQVAGDGLSAVWALASELLDDYLPDRAWAFLDRWEAVMRLAPTAGDSIETRRARVLAFMRKVHGYTRDKILDAVVPLLDVDSAADLQIIENTNTFLDAFPGAALGPSWSTETPSGSAVVSGGALTLTADAGEDARWTMATATDPQGARARVSVGESLGMEMVAAIDPSGLVDDGAHGGIFLRASPVDQGALLFGVKRDEGNLVFFHRRIWRDVDEGGSLHQTGGIGEVIPAGSLYWLRMVRRFDGTEQEWTLQYRVDGAGFDGPWTTYAAGLDAGEPPLTPLTWAGAYVAADDNPTTSANSIDVADFRIVERRSGVVFQWFIYRDPALGGSPDFDGARQVIARMKPAHTNGQIIESLALRCDTEYSGCDITPLGA